MILLDTQVVIWLASGKNRLGAIAHQTIDSAWQNNEVYVSSITFWEIAMLLSKNRIEEPIDIEALYDELIREGLKEIPVTARIGIRAVNLENFHADPADRLIVATAILDNLQLISSDRLILNWTGQLNRIDARE